MTRYLVLARILNADLFAQYIKGHLPSITQFGGKVIFRSTQNESVHGSENWDAIAIQEWPDNEAFECWWNSEEYRPWSQMRDKAAIVSIVRCEGHAQENF